jgi:hypothetical protein
MEELAVDTFVVYNKTRREAGIEALTETQLTGCDDYTLEHLA